MNEKLLSLIQDLQKRVEKLEKDNKDLKKWAYREKKKVNVIAWLNEHYLPTEDFNDWVKTIKITESELLEVFHDGLARGISDIIKQKLPLENRRHFPIIAFKHQIKSIFYVFEGKTWRKIKKDEELFAHYSIGYWLLHLGTKVEDMEEYGIRKTRNQYYDLHCFLNYLRLYVIGGEYRNFISKSISARIYFFI